jgi:hypothetical protein
MQPRRSPRSPQSVNPHGCRVPVALSAIDLAAAAACVLRKQCRTTAVARRRQLIT